MDVVPVSEGWDFPAFSGEIKDGLCTAAARSIVKVWLQWKLARSSSWHCPEN